MGTAASSRAKVTPLIEETPGGKSAGGQGSTGGPGARKSIKSPSSSPARVPLSPKLAAVQAAGVTVHSSRHCFAFDTMVVVADPTAVELRLVELYVGSDSNALTELRVFTPGDALKKTKQKLDRVIALISCTAQANYTFPDHPAAFDVIPADGRDGVTLCPPSAADRDALMDLILTCSDISTGRDLLLSAQPLSAGGKPSSLLVEASASVGAVRSGVAVVFDGVSTLEDMVEEKEDLMDSVVEAVQSAVPVLEQLGADDLVDAASSVGAVVMGVAGDAMAYIESLSHSVPFVGGIVSALNGVFKAYKLVKARDKAVAKFVERLKDAVITLDKLLRTFMSKPGLPDPVSKLLTGAPPQLEALEKLVRSSEGIIKGMCDQNIILKFVKANQDIATLAEKGLKLGECLQSMAVFLQVTGIELQVATFQSMKEDNEALMRAIKDLSSKPDAVSGSNLTEISKLMDVKETDMKACMAAGFEALTAEIVNQFDRDIGPYRLIDNPTFRYIWKNYLVGSDHTSRDTFIASLRSYWRSKREATANGQGGAEDDLLSEANVATLMNVMDTDGNGKVYVTEVNKAVAQVSPSQDSVVTSFEDLIARLVKAGKYRVVKKLLDVHLTQYEERKLDLQAYIHPLVIEEVPGNMSLTEYVGKLDEDGRGALPVPEELIPGGTSSAGGLFQAFLTGVESLFLLLGEPGSGKSLFTWHRCKLREGVYRQVKDGNLSMSETDPWIPVAIDLKNHCLSGIKGLLRRHLKEECNLTAQELSMLQALLQPHSISTSAGDVAPIKLKLLVFCDGFDELRAESTPDAAVFKDFVAELLDGLHVEAKVVVTCRDRHFKGGREEENRIFQHVGKPHVRRVLLPFRKSQIDEYIERWTATSLTTDNGPSPFAQQLSEKLPALHYHLAIQSSGSLQQIVRNPFVLRLFVDALPHLCDANGRVDVSSVTRYSIYSVFVRQYITRQLKKWGLNGGRWMPSEMKSSAGRNPVSDTPDDELIADVERLCAQTAGMMFASNTLTIELDEKASAWGFVRDEFFEVDVEFVETRAKCDWRGMRSVDRFRFEDDGIDEGEFVRRAVRAVKRRRLVVLDNAEQVCPLRKNGDGFAFLHKSFYEYFLATLVLHVGSDPLYSEELRVRRMTRMLGSGGRRWQSEPEAIYFLCDKWWASDGQEATSVIQCTRRCLFGVVESSALVSGEEQSPSLQGVTASANAATLLNWANEPFSGVRWDGVQLAGADLSFAVFVGASLRGANLSRCLLKKAVLSGADLTGANLEGVNFAERAPMLLGSGEDATAVVKTGAYICCLVDGALRISSTIGSYRVTLYGNRRVCNVIAVEGYVGGRCVDGSVIIWETLNFQRVWYIPAGAVPCSCVAFGRQPNQTFMFVGSADGSVVVWDGDRQRVVFSMPSSTRSACSAMCVDNTCCTLCVGRESGEVHILSVEDAGSLVVTGTFNPGNGKAITNLAVAPEFSSSPLIAVCVQDGEAVKIWNCRTGEPLHTLAGHSKPVKCLAFSRPAPGRPQLLATGSDDNECRLWDVASGQQYGPALQGHTGAVLSVEFESDERGMLVSVGGDQCVRFWDIDSANAYREQLHVSGNVIAIRGNAAGSGFVSVDTSGAMFDWEISNEATAGTVALIPRYPQRVNAVGAAFQAGLVMCVGPVDSSGSPVVAIGQPNGTLSVWRGGSMTELGNVSKSISKLCFVGPDRIAASTEDGTLQLWSAGAGGPPRTLMVGMRASNICLVCSEGPPPLLACSRTEVNALLDTKQMLRCWALDSETDNPTCEVRGDGAYTVLSFGPLGRTQMLAVGTSYAIEVRDARSGRLSRILSTLTEAVRSLAWLSPTRLASSSPEDLVIRVWDVDIGLCQQSFSSVSSVPQLLPACSANALVAACEDDILRVWDVVTWELVTQSRSHVNGPFASGLHGVTSVSGGEMRLLETCGFNAEFSSVCSAVMVGACEPEQLLRGLAHRLTTTTRDAFQRAFLRYVRSHGVATGLDAALFTLIEMSKSDAKLAVPAGNAASCLNWLCSARQSSALTELDWCGVRLTGADLSGADLSRTRFEGAELIGCDFLGATLSGADFSGVDLTQCTLVSPIRALPGSKFALSPPRRDGSVLLASVCNTVSDVRGKIILVWEPASGECIAELKGHTREITCVMFGAQSDGALWLASASKDSLVRLWDMGAGGFAYMREGHADEVTCLSFGTRLDGRLLLASGSVDKTVRLWGVEAGGDSVAVLRGHTGKVTCLSFGSCSGGKLMLASGSDDSSVRLWDVEAGCEAVTVLSGHTDAVTCLNFGVRSDGRVLLAGGSKSGAVQLWDVDAGGESLRMLSGHTEPVTGLAFGSREDGGLLLASASEDTTVWLWDIQDGWKGVELAGHTGAITSLTFSRSSESRLLLASGSQDGAVRLWEVTAGHTRTVSVLGGFTRRKINCLTFCVGSDGKLVFACGGEDNTVRLWNVEPLRVALSARRFVGLSVSLSSASVKANAVLSRELLHLEAGRPCLASGEYVTTLRLNDSSGIAGFSISPDGTTFVVSNSEWHKVSAYRLRDSALIIEFGGKGSEPGKFNSPRKLCFSPRSNNILVADGLNQRVQEMTLSGSYVRTIGVGVIESTVECVAASNEAVVIGQEGTGAQSDFVLVFDMASGDLIGSFGRWGLAEGKMLGAFGLRFTPDGGRILCTDFGNNRLSEFTLMGEFERCIGVGVLSGPYDVEFSPSGEIIVSEWLNSRVCVFSPDGGTLLRSFGSEGDVPGQLKRPTALGVYGGNLFVLDQHRACVQVFT